MKFLFNYTSRSRPDNFFRGMDSIINNLSGKHDFKIVVTLDSDDETMVNDEVLLKLREYKNTTYYVGVSKNKIDAINRSIPHFPETWDVLINFSDDMIFTEKNFDEIIAKDIEEIGDTDCYLHYRDSNHKRIDALSTLHIVGREYFERDCHVYDPDFISVWCDNWNDDVAKARGKYHFFDKIIFDHRHCVYNKAPRDAQYERTEDRRVYSKDRSTYLRKKKNINQYL